MTSRRDLKADYKRTARPMGIWCVRNLVNGKVLIGASPDLPGALNRHPFQLRAGAHGNRDLQADWRALGADSFAVEILDELPPGDDPARDVRAELAALEALWLEELRPWGERGYHPESPDP